MGCCVNLWDRKANVWEFSSNAINNKPGVGLPILSNGNKRVYDPGKRKINIRKELLIDVKATLM